MHVEMGVFVEECQAINDACKCGGFVQKKIFSKKEKRIVDKFKDKNHAIPTPQKESNAIPTPQEDTFMKNFETDFKSNFNLDTKIEPNILPKFRLSSSFSSSSLV